MELINVLVDLDTRLRSAAGVYRGQVICGCIGNSCNHFDLDLPSAIKKKQETYGTYCESADTGNIVQDILNLSDSVLEKLLELTDPMMELVNYLNKHRNPDNKTLSKAMTASKNVLRVMNHLREVSPFAGQDFAWLDEKLFKVFAAERVTKEYTERKKEQGELFVQAMCLVAQQGFGIRDFWQALITLVEPPEHEVISRNSKGFSKKCKTLI